MLRRKVELDVFESIGRAFGLLLFFVASELHADGTYVELFAVSGGWLRVKCFLVKFIHMRVVALLVWLLLDGKDFASV